MRAAGAKEFVAPWSPIAADYIDLAAGIVETQREVVEQVKEPRIEVTHVPGAVVAEIVIELVQRIGQVGIAAPVDDVKMFACVSVIKAQPVLGRGRLGDVQSVSNRRYK